MDRTYRQNFSDVRYCTDWQTLSRVGHGWLQSKKMQSNQIQWSSMNEPPGGSGILASLNSKGGVRFQIYHIYPSFTVFIPVLPYLSKFYRIYPSFTVFLCIYTRFTILYNIFTKKKRETSLWTAPNLGFPHWLNIRDVQTSSLRCNSCNFESF